MDDLRAAADSLEASERRLVAQSDALTELTGRYTKVERLSMWG